ncbi:hypothetical protein GCM10027059_19110 [Myceligenerans halotolerans]
MARRPNTQDPARAARPPTTRLLAPVLAVAATLTLSACSVTLNPGPGEAAFEASRWQLGEATEPVQNAVAAGSASDAEPGPGPENEPVVENRSADGDGTSAVDAVESGTVDVQPAPEKTSPEDGDDGASSDTGGDTAGDDAGAGGNSGDGTGGDDDGSAAEPDLSDAVQYARALEAEVNERREAHGVTALAHDDCAYAEALERAEALRGMDLAHAPLEPIFDRCPTSTVGENLARGGWSPAEAADGWMNSEGHRANILNAGFTRGAIACISENTSYGSQMTCAHVFLG